MNKTELIKYVAQCSGLSKAKAKRSIDCYHKAIQGTIKEGESVSLVGFGTFKVARRKARRGRNPQTGEIMKIKAKKVPKFVAGKALKDAVIK